MRAQLYTIFDNTRASAKSVFGGQSLIMDWMDTSKDGAIIKSMDSPENRNEVEERLRKAIAYCIHVQSDHEWVTDEIDRPTYAFQINDKPSAVARTEAKGSYRKMQR